MTRVRLTIGSMLVAAAALAAVSAGHAIELTLESHGGFGGVRAAYAHTAQLPIVEIAALLFVLAAVAVFDSIHRTLNAKRPNADWLVPALDAIRAVGTLRLYAALAAVQIPAFVTGELIEQRAAGFSGPSLAAIFGAGHWSSAVVQLVVGLAAVLALRRAAKFITAHARAMAEAIEAVIARIDPRPSRNLEAGLRALVTEANAVKPPVLARRIANRPPPVSSPIVQAA